MDVSLLIRQRLNELGLDQKNLAAAAQVTESYISQLLAGKKVPPAPGRTDIYEKIGQFLKLPSDELSQLANAQRKLELQKRIADLPAPLFRDLRELILRKCAGNDRAELRRIFEKEPFGELERLVAQKILEVGQGVAREKLRSEEWLRRMADANAWRDEQVPAAIQEFLDSDILHVPMESCVSLLDRMIESWDIDLKTFAMAVVIDRRMAAGGIKRFEFTEKMDEPPHSMEPGFEQFLKDKSLSGDATAEEIEFLRGLRFKERRPAALYYYRELQSLRDPLHFLNTRRG